MQASKKSPVLPPLKTNGAAESNTNKGTKQKGPSKATQRKTLNPVVVTRKIGANNPAKPPRQTTAQISVSGSQLITEEGGEPISPNESQAIALRNVIRKGRPKSMDPGKMSLVCQLKMKSLRREMYLLKQSIPPTDDIVELLREKAAFDTVIVQKLKVSEYIK